MGKSVEKKKLTKTKKKGRPSLKDLKKRSLKIPNSTPLNSKNTLRRSTRRNPIPSDSDEEEDEKLPRVVAESNADACTVRKRKINTVNVGSDGADAVKAEILDSGANCQQGNRVESGPSTTPLPDKTLLLIILQRLQKLDKYGVFSEPVDPEELPDYHDIIKHPMDFTTLRKKLDSGDYANLEQFEKDVFLICSNAMQYNASDTIYFRQARSIQDLAKKSFENLRQDSDDNEAERTTARRGRPPAYYVKKPPGRPVIEHLVSEGNSNTMFAAGVESRTLFNNDMRKGSPGEKSYNNEGYRGCTTVNRWDRTDGFSGSLRKSQSDKYGNKQFFGDEDPRNTYLHPHLYTSKPDTALLGRESKQFVAVGHFSGHGYARSLALFAANLGPLAWKPASKKIERSLPAGIKFGPGWVGENDVVQHRPTALIGHSLKHFAVARSSSPVAETSSKRNEEQTEKHAHNSSEMSKKSPTDNILGEWVPSIGTVDKNSSTCVSQSAIPSSLASASLALDSTTLEVKTAVLNTPSPFNSVNEIASINKPNASFQTRQSPSSHPHLIRINGFNRSPQMEKLIGVSRPFETSPTPGSSPKTNKDYVHQAVPSISNHEDEKSSEISKLQSGTRKNFQLDQLAPHMSGLFPKPSSESMSLQSSDMALQRQGLDSAPPDLNVMFQSPGSPSTCKVDSVHPDLALQL